MTDRIGRPVPLASLVADAAAACQRITGHTVDWWDEEFARRRSAGYRRGHFRGGVMLQLASEKSIMTLRPGEVTELDAFCRRYGLWEEDDLLCLERVPVESVIQSRRGTGLPSVRIPSHEGRAARRLTVYMLNPDKYPR